MDFSKIGPYIKELRVSLGIRQQELAEGICTQAQISKIEKGDVYPLAPTLYLLAQRLGVDYSYFMEMSETPRLDYVKEMTRYIRQKIRERDYQAVSDYLHAEKNNPLFLVRPVKQFMLWHEGICIYYLQKNLPRAVELIEKALNLRNSTSKNYSEREIEITNSLGIIYFEEEDYIQSEYYFLEGIDQYFRVPHRENHHVIIRLYYNYAKLLTRIGNFMLSTDYCKKGIKICIDNELLYLLGELYYHIGYNLLKANQAEKCKEYLDKSLFLFTLQGNDAFVAHIRSMLRSTSIQDETFPDK